MNATYQIQEMKESQYALLKDFLYEAIFVPEGVKLPSKAILDVPELQIYIENFGTRKSDHALVAIKDNDVVGVIWTRIMNDYGHIDVRTSSLAMSVYKEYRGLGIGRALLNSMFSVLKHDGYEQVSLSVQKNNYAYKLYTNVGFYIVDENKEEYIMAKKLQ